MRSFCSFLTEGGGPALLMVVMGAGCGDGSGADANADTGLETAGDGADGDLTDDSGTSGEGAGADTGDDAGDAGAADLPEDEEFDCFDDVDEPGELCLWPRGPLVVSGLATSVIHADLDVDGHLDLVVGSVTSSDVVRLTGDGDGWFADPGSTLMGQGLRALAVAEIDDSPGLDLAFVNVLSGLVGVASGDGSGGFGNPVASLVQLQAPRHLVLVDMDADGHLDLAIADEAADELVVLYGPGLTASARVDVGNTPYEVEAVDVDGDGLLDLLSVDEGSDTLSLARGLGERSFEAATPIAVGAGPRGLAAGDLDGDGDLDIVTADHDDATLSVLHNRFDEGLGLELAQSLPIGDAPYTVVLADMDGDGPLDAVVPLAGLDAVGLARGSEEGVFGQRTAISTGGTQPLVLTVADFDEDGRPDIAVGNTMSPTVGLLISSPPP